jgi:hypothetical protein
MARQDFFLSPDEAKTLGDIIYMRKPVKVKRSFPKTQNNQSSFEIEKEISSLEDKNRSLNGNTASSNNFIPTSTSEPDYIASTKGVTEAQKSKSVEERHRQDSSLDMFRNMVRSIKKK